MIKIKEEMLSVGIDIGTSTTQLVFSKLIIENLASSYSVPRIVIADKKIIYKSDIYFTPLLSAVQIDGNGVKEIVEKEFYFLTMLRNYTKWEPGAVLRRCQPF